jgi:hypothetical protein
MLWAGRLSHRQSRETSGPKPPNRLRESGSSREVPKVRITVPFKRRIETDGARLHGRASRRPRSVAGHTKKGMISRCSSLSIRHRPFRGGYPRPRYGLILNVGVRPARRPSLSKKLGNVAAKHERRAFSTAQRALPAPLNMKIDVEPSSAPSN